MNITPEEAKQALSDIENVTKNTRRAFAHSGWPHAFIIWGFVWFFGFMASQFIRTTLLGWIWIILDAIGVVAMIIVGRRMGRRVRTDYGKKLNYFWGALMLYAVLWIWIAWPMPPDNMALLISTIALFGYIVMGIWLNSSIVWLGLGLTVLSIIGYLLVPDYFALWMSVLVGGLLIGSGFFMLRLWRQP